MKGIITKKHFFEIWKSFGFKKAIKVLTSKEEVALAVLVS